MKDAEKADSLQLKAKNGGKSDAKELDKFARNCDLAKEKAKAADNEYQSLLLKTNAFQKEHYEKSQPALLQEYEDWDIERVDKCKKNVFRFFRSIWRRSKFFPTFNVDHLFNAQSCFFEIGRGNIRH